MNENRITASIFTRLKNSRKRHIAKSITWRLIATLTTFILTLFFFREHPNATEKAGWVVLAETSIKMVLYYYHERIWFINKLKISSVVRHLLKTISWRIIASITTFVLALTIFRDDPGALEKATAIAGIESLLKMAFYYLHERFWHKSKFGLE